MFPHLKFGGQDKKINLEDHGTNQNMALLEPKMFFKM